MTSEPTSIESQLLTSLLGEWGYVMGSAALRKTLGFATQQSLRVAIRKGHVPFPLFELEGRKGVFARTHDVAAWLASRGPAGPKEGEGDQGLTTRPPHSRPA
jgi:hypothetical protein